MMPYPRAALFAVTVFLALSAAAAERLVLDFNPDWRFVKADPAGAEAPAFDDHAWIPVSAPHTYNDVDTFDNWSTPGHRGEQIQWSGRTWYRKSFTAPDSWRGRRVFIEFEAARQIAEVYLNGQKLGTSKTGFTPFGFDLTPHLRLGATNVLAVMVDNRFMKDPLEGEGGGKSAKAPKSSAKDVPLANVQKEFNVGIPEKIEDLRGDQIPWNNPHWHPAHGGLYRNVRLHVTDPLHITLPLYSFLQTEGPYAYATDISADRAQVTVEVPVENGRAASSDVDISVVVSDAAGAQVLVMKAAATVAPGERRKVTVSGVLARPRLWEPAYPHVYRVRPTLRVGAEVVDSADVPLGIRVARWSVDGGLRLNGTPLKLHGWGQKPTDEWPGLGAAQPDWLHAFTLELMRQAGGNFVRWGHTAAGPAQISAGDRLGIIADQPGVDGESDTVRAAWRLRMDALRDVLVYFRNHPSILVWEGGNQKVIREHGAEVRALVDRFDPHGGRALAFRRADATTAAFMDVGVGTEGFREISTLPAFEGEYDREESPRRVWDNASPPNFGYPEAKGMTYQLTSEQFAANQVTQFKKLSPAWHSGGANWIFSDSTSGGRVPAEVARASGEVDGVRLPKEAYAVCAVLYGAGPGVHLIGHWTYPAGTRKDVFVAARADDVELFLNGRSLGHGVRSDGYLFTFKDVAFEPGEIKAVASEGGKVVAEQARHTVGKPVALRVTPIVSPAGLRADGADVALFDVEAVDAKGERCPTVQQRVDFAVEGPAIWRGGYNSGKIDSINHTYLDLEAGVNRVAIRSTRQPGAITLRATSDGLAPGSVTVTAQSVAIRDGFAQLPPPVRAVLPATVPAHPQLTVGGVATRAARAVAGPGRFIRSFNYTGPGAALAKVVTSAAAGRPLYADRDFALPALPASLAGADWLQLPDADALYSALDLIELGVAAGTTITIAHDDRVRVPGWLATQFQRTDGTILVDGVPLRLFTRTVKAAESVTLGSNDDAAAAKGPAHMYVVFVNTSQP